MNHNLILDQYNFQIEKQKKYANSLKKYSQDPEDEISSIFCSSIIERVSKLLDYPGLEKLLKDNWNRQIKIEDLCLIICQKIINLPSLLHIDPGNSCEIIEKCVRITTAILTEGTVSAPVEGITAVNLKERQDYLSFPQAIRDTRGKYVEIRFSGPIRGSGATAQVLSVMIAEYTRKKLNVGIFDPTDEQISRTIVEVQKYNRLHPLQKEIITRNIDIAYRNCPICISGESTELEEVDSFKYLPRVPSPRIRGGMVLVLQEGIIGRASKVEIYNEKLKMEWNWITKIIENQKTTPPVEGIITNQAESIPGHKKKMILGRPLLSEAREGGLRIRIGRTRLTGNCAIGLHPFFIRWAKFINIGSQLRTDFPGKSALVTPCDEVEPPLVYYIDNNGLPRHERLSERILLDQDIISVTDLGQVLIAAGEFLEQNTDLKAIGYTFDSWRAEIKSNIEFKKLIPLFSSILNSEKGIERQRNLRNFYNQYNFPVLPAHRLSSGISKIDIKYRKEFLAEKITLSEKVLKELLDHHMEFYPISKTEVVLESPFIREALEKKQYLLYPLYYGCRVGRSEASKPCTMKPFAHSLSFHSPVSVRRSLKDCLGTRNIMKIREKGCGNNSCQAYLRGTTKNLCISCNQRTTFLYRDIRIKDDSKKEKEPEEKLIITKKTREKIPETERKYYVSERTITTEFFNSKEVYSFLNKTKVDPKKVKGLTEQLTMGIEPIEKGILRAKYDVTTFKDGTCRYDLTDMVCTHFIPSEIGLTLEKLTSLGYLFNSKGERIKSVSETVTLFSQDLIVSTDCMEYLFKVTKYLDELCLTYYNASPYYNYNEPSDLIGELVLGIAPHICSATIGRIIGSTLVRGLYSHPFFTSVKRRNCVSGDEDSLVFIQNEGYRFIKMRDINKLDFNKTRVVSVTPKGQLISKKIIDTFKKEEKELLLIKTKDNSEIKVTRDHKMIVIENGELVERLAENLKVGDSIPLVGKIKLPELKFVLLDSSLKNLLETKEKRFYYKTRNKVDNILNLDFNLGYLVGLLVSDGFIRQTRSKNVHKFVYRCIWYGEEQTIDRVVGIINQKFDKRIKRIMRKDNLNYCCLSGSIYYNIFRHILSVGKKDEKSVLKALSFNLEYIKGVLSGYLEGDGSTNDSDIRICSSNKRLLAELDILCRSLGLLSSKYSFLRDTNLKKNSQCHELRFYRSSDKKLIKAILKGRKENFEIKEGNLRASRELNQVLVTQIKEISVVQNSEQYVYDYVLEGDFKSFFSGYGMIASIDCDGDEDSLFLLLDSFLNYSLTYIPQRRGRLMNIPYLINKIINPKELDKEVYNTDNAAIEEYPYHELELKTHTSKELSKIIPTYSVFKKKNVNEVYSHVASSLTLGTLKNSYLDLNDTTTKLEMILELTEKIRCVPVEVLAQRLLSCHLLPDLIGNTRTYLNQNKKCKTCKLKFSRVPLTGKCPYCQTELIPTVYYNMVIKYLDKINKFRVKYKSSLPLYLLERIELAIGDLVVVSALKEGI